MWFFRHVADAVLKGRQVFPHILSMEGDPALGGLDQSSEHFDGSAFAGAVGSKISEDLAWLDGEAHMVDDGNPAVELG